MAEEAGAKRVSQSIMLHFEASELLCQRLRGHSRIMNEVDGAARSEAGTIKFGDDDRLLDVETYGAGCAYIPSISVNRVLKKNNAFFRAQTGETSTWLRGSPLFTNRFLYTFDPQMSGAAAASEKVLKCRSEEIAPTRMCRVGACTNVDPVQIKTQRKFVAWVSRGNCNRRVVTVMLARRPRVTIRFGP